MNDQTTKPDDNKDDVIASLKSQLSTLQAQMRDVIYAGDEMETLMYSDKCELSIAWVKATASLRQSGHK